MSRSIAPIPSSSQTVGPYFRIGFDYLIEWTPALTLDMPGTIQLRGRVLDRDGAPVSDAMLEFWCAASTESRNDGKPGGFPPGFRRTATDDNGGYSVVMPRPVPAKQRDQPPYMLVLVFARGLLRHLISRVYLGDMLANENDPVLNRIPHERRATLIARPDESLAGMYWWDVILQGSGETVFFAW